MEHRNYKRVFAIILSIVLLCAFCLMVSAEDAVVGVGNETTAEEWHIDVEESFRHGLWGFFRNWAEGNIDRMTSLCTFEWRKGKENPGQAMREILEVEKPHGYRMNGFSGKDGDPVRTASIILQWETEKGEYTCRLYEIKCLLSAEGYYEIEPEGFCSGVPTEPVPEEELLLLTAEGIVRNGIELHAEKGLYDRMIPINIAVEKEGIRVEAVSGLVQGKMADFVITVQDVEGKYSGYNLSASFRENLDGTYEGWSMQLYHDEKESKDYYYIHQDLEQPVKAEGEYAKLGVLYFWIQQDNTVNLLPLLKEYGITEEGVKPPVLDTHNSYNQEKYDGTPEDLKVLDYKHPLDVSLFGSHYLTGIGWIGDQLHVQFHNKGQDYVNMRNGRGSAGGAWAYCSIDGRTYHDVYPDYNPLSWDGDNDGWPDWRECIFNCRPEDMDLLELSAEITTVKDILDSEWTVYVPLETIRLASDPEPAGEAGEVTEGTESE